MAPTETQVSSARKLIQPILFRLFGWYRENRQATLDLIVLLLLSILTYFFIVRNDLMDQFYVFTKQHEELELDDLVLTLGIVSSVYVSIFAIRRWLEAASHLRQANTDTLTNLLNRRKGWETMEYEITRSNRYKHPLSIIMLDIDNFKAINDTHGHIVGDHVLITVANVAREAIRSIDNLIRWGGEEFIVLLPDTDLEAALRLAERLREAIEKIRIQVPYEELKITASFGVVTKDENTPDIATLLARSDQAMYVAKYLGRNRVATSK